MRKSDIEFTEGITRNILFLWLVAREALRQIDYNFLSIPFLFF
jgi:hypothetical protein